MTDPSGEDRPEVLARLAEGPVVPSRLEERVVAELRQRGILRQPRTRPTNRWLRPLLVAAAVVAAFAIGRLTSSRGQAAVGQRWLLMLYEDRDFEAPSPDGQADRVEEYRRWGVQVRAVDGAELGPDGYLIERDAAPSLVEPDQQTLGRAAGFFIVPAASLEQAKRIATTCPHLKYRGRVVVRPLS